MKRHLGTAVLALCALVLAAAFALAADAGAGKPKAVAVEPIKEMNTVAKGDKIIHDFMIRNEGTVPLEITEVRPACGCTVASFDKKIAPGQSGKVHVEMDTETFTGAIAKGVTVFTNDTENPQIELTIRAAIRPLILVKPGYARYIIVQNEEKEGKIVQTVWAPDGAPMDIVKAESPVPYIHVEYHEAKPDELLPEAKGKQWKVEMRLDRDAPVGALGDFVRLTTTHPKQKMVEIPISGFVRPMIAVTPPVADFTGVQLSKEPFKRTFVVKTYASAPIKVTSVDSTVKGIETQLEPKTEGREYLIHVTLKPEMAKGPFNGKLSIHTDNPKKPLVEVELKGTVV